MSIDDIILPNEIINVIFQFAATDNDTISTIRQCCRKWVKLPYLVSTVYNGLYEDYFAIYTRNTLYVSDGEWRIWKTKYHGLGARYHECYYRVKIKNKSLGYSEYRTLDHGYDSKLSEHYYCDTKSRDLVIRMYRNIKHNNIKYIIYLNHDEIKYLVFRTNVCGNQLLNFDVKLKTKT